MSAFRYGIHRIALLPFTTVEQAVWLADIRLWLKENDEQSLITFLIQQGLAPLWHRLIQHSDAGPIFSDQRIESLRLAAVHAAQIYLIQKHSLSTVNETLEGHGIDYVIFKGAHLREILYDQPLCRTALDIDLLVSPEKKHEAIAALIKKGYTLHASATSISHEATLVKDQVSIDIHWDILRPGRTRQPMTPVILAERKHIGSHWGPSIEHSLFLMLVHPVITKYATSPLSTINRLLDIMLCIRKQEIDWEAVQKMLASSGLQTAGWIMLEWLRQITGICPPPAFVQAIKPGTIKRRYLELWLAGDYSTRLLRYHTIIRAAFTLPAHDTLHDVVRATRSLYSEKQNAQAHLDALAWAQPLIK
ncbi:MAG: hypothetical protein VR73_05965 [Gammaproteobacteria bacterium BRH_c0]|nr:MAG: hypothetical protein VR73_05965 [Gammaproteobacteria bacterium BRH_c0]